MPLRSRRRPAHRRPTPRRLGIQLESLEPRCLLATVALDPSFGVGGLVTTDIGTARDASAPNSHDYVGEALRQPDGKLLLAGTSNQSAHDFALLRYNADGTLDTDFGDQGAVVTDFAGTSDWGRGITLQDDGKIIIAGHASRNWNFDFGVARYNPDGSLDTDFDGDGIAFASIPGTELRVGDVVLQGDGKIVIAGTSQEGAGNYTESVALARLNADGSLDGSFGVAGTVFEPASGVSQSAKSMILQSDGKLVVSGSRKDDAGTVAYLARYNSDGSPDETFAGTGQVLTSPHGNGRNVLLQPDGKLLQVSWSNTGLSMARYHSDGTPDSSFGVDGLRAHFGLGTARAATLQGDGKILVSLVNHNVDPATSRVERFHSDGSLDAAFHEASESLALNFNGTDHSLVLSEDGKLLVAGDAFNPSTDESSGIDDPFNGFHYDITLAQFILDTAPSFALSADSHTVDEDSPAQNIVGFATDIAPGVNGGTVTFEIVNNKNPDLFAQQPAISNSGTLSYQPTADAWGEAVITVRAVNEGGEASEEQSFRIIVQQLNDAPVLDTSLNPTLAPAREDATNPASTLVSSLLTGAVSDPDEGARQGIAIGTTSDYHGVWEYRLNNYVEWQPVGSVSESAALLLPGWSRLRFIPKADFNGTVKLYYRAWDQTQGSPGERFNLSGKTGGANAFSVALEGAALTVTPVNDAPVLDTSPITRLDPVLEDTRDPAGTPVWKLTRFALFDHRDLTAPVGIAVVGIDSSHGLWQYQLESGSDWLAIGEPSHSAALLLPGWARVRFVPEADFHAKSSISYHGWDEFYYSPGERPSIRGALGGDRGFSVAKETAYVTVTQVNDPPTLSLGGTIGYQRDASPIVLAPFATVADIDSVNVGDGQLRVWITNGASNSNRLVIGSGFTVDADRNVLQGDRIIGRRSSNGVGTKELVITFNRSATPSIAQQLARAIAFKTVGGAAGQRTILFTLSDGDGGLSDEALKTVNVT